MAAPICYVCTNAERETRPYGKDKQPICFPCMQSDPERKEEAFRQLAALMAGTGPDIVLTPEGPRTLTEADLLDPGVHVVHSRHKG